MAKFPWRSVSMAVLLGASAVNHFRNPKFYYPVLPPSLCTDQGGDFAVFSRSEWVSLSGVVEAGLAAGLLLRPTRKLSGTLTAGMLAAFTVAHLSHIKRAFTEPEHHSERVFAVVRLPLQVPLVWWARSTIKETSSARRLS